MGSRFAPDYDFHEKFGVIQNGLAYVKLEEAIYDLSGQRLDIDQKQLWRLSWRLPVRFSVDGLNLAEAFSAVVLAGMRNPTTWHLRVNDFRTRTEWLASQPPVHTEGEVVDKIIAAGQYVLAHHPSGMGEAVTGIFLRQMRILTMKPLTLVSLDAYLQAALDLILDP